MPTLLPFRALRYNPARAGDLSRLIAPPYDVIRPEERAAWTARSPYNIVRLELPQDEPPLDRYAVARATFQRWLADGALAQDPAPALYLYEHTFDWQGTAYRRLGVLGLVGLTDASVAQVLKHEATFEGPKADRLKLMDAVQANLSPVFCVAPDADGAFARWLTEARDAAPPAATAAVSERESARVWAVTDPQRIAAAQRLLAAKTVMIADGHHRFSVAVSRRAEHSSAMCFFAPMDDPAVVMRPIHRVVDVPAAKQAAWTEGLARLCELEPASGAAEMSVWLAAQTGPGRFGYYERGRYWQVTVREPLLRQWAASCAGPKGLATLDVTLLHQLLLPQLLGQEGLISAASAHTSTGGSRLCDYTADLAEAVGLAGKLPGGCAWLLRPIPLAQVYGLAAQGITVAQKTTYFHPKLLSGLFINRFPGGV